MKPLKNKDCSGGTVFPTIHTYGFKGVARVCACISISLKIGIKAVQTLFLKGFCVPVGKMPTVTTGTSLIFKRFFCHGLKWPPVQVNGFN